MLSCGGVRNLKDGIVDFAGSDAFLSDKEMAEMQPVVHIPTCMGAVVMAYNLPDVVKLNLSGDVIADIYAGKITDWNDARLQKLNPDVQLPAKKRKSFWHTVQMVVEQLSSLQTICQK